MKKSVVILLIVAITLVSGCGSSTLNSAPKEQTLHISAAASLKDVLNRAKALYEKEHSGVEVQINFASSGTLQHQIEQGAPADVFISAGGKQMKVLKDKNLVGTPVNLAGNRLVIAVPVDRALPITDIHQLTNKEYGKVSIGNVETVPAGKYAEEALRNAGIYEQVRSKIIYAKDVRQVLAYVETGNVDAGFIYYSDSQVTDKVKTYSISEDMYSPIVYPAAVVKASKNDKLAWGFLMYLQEEQVQKILQEYGFLAGQ